MKTSIVSIVLVTILMVIGHQSANAQYRYGHHRAYYRGYERCRPVVRYCPPPVQVYAPPVAYYGAPQYYVPAPPPPPRYYRRHYYRHCRY